MNAEQLHTISSIVIRDVDESGILKTLQNLNKHLQQLAGNPGDTNAQQNVSNTRAQLFSGLDALEAKRWPSGFQQTVSELGGDILLDGELRQQVQEAFTAEAITPSTAQQKTTQLTQQVDSFVSRIRALVGALKELGVEEEPLEPGEVELGVLIPRAEIENKLNELASEISKFDKIFKLFSVVATGTREDFEVAYISSSDPKIFIKPDLKTAALIAATVTFILDSLNQIADLKLKVDEIRNGGVKEEYFDRIEEGIKNKLENEFEEKRKELLEEFGNHSKATDQHENENRLKIAIEQLASRLERGYSVEVRLEPLPAPEGGEADDKEETADRRYVEALQQQAARLKRLDAIGRPILSLPRPDSLDEIDGDNNEGASK